jgi:hypothetical protein
MENNIYTCHTEFFIFSGKTSSPEKHLSGNYILNKKIKINIESKSENQKNPSPLDL